MNVDLFSARITITSNCRQMADVAGFLITESQLEALTYEDLRKLQDKLIPLYNDAVNYINNFGKRKPPEGEQ